MKLRAANDADCRLLWEWVNDPEVRRFAFQSAPIGWQQHQAWFAAKRQDRGGRIYLVLNGRRAPIGQVRFDRSADGEAEVDISIAAGERGRGFGAQALRLACARFCRETGVRRLVSRIKRTNVSSLRAFSSAGFSEAGALGVNGSEAVRLRWEPGGRQTTPAVYMVAARRPQSLSALRAALAGLPGRWIFIERPEQLSIRRLRAIAPRVVFFVHWSTRVPTAVTERYECVGFHMTDLPYGRGGSPLQNLIRRGYRTTMLSAFRMTGGLDDGPVYLKAPLSLDGMAEEIYLRAASLAGRMIARILREQPVAQPQRGRTSVFRRRTPLQSRIPQCADLSGLFDFVRMLDAEGYPRAFLRDRGFRYELSRPALRNGRIQAAVTITPIRKPRA